MATKNPERRDRRSEVLEAAIKLFVAKGYYATSMDDVASAVHLNKGTLYHYYDSKASILFDLLLQITEQRLAVTHATRHPAPPDIILMQHVEDMVLFTIKNLMATKLSLQESPFIDFWLNKEQAKIIRSRLAELNNFLKNLIENGIAAGVFSNTDPRVAAEFITGMVSWIPRWYRPAGKMDAAQVAQQLSTFTVNALRGGSVPMLNVPAAEANIRPSQS